MIISLGLALFAFAPLALVLLLLAMILLAVSRTAHNTAPPMTARTVCARRLLGLALVAGYIAYACWH